jgi:lipopolysaccharide export system protein LptA
MQPGLHKTINNMTAMLHPALLLVPALLAVPLCALGADSQRQLPVHLSADRIDVDQRKGLSLYRGHVLLNQGTLRLTAARAEVRNRANLLETVTAEGKPATFRYRPEGSAEFVEGEASRAVYHALTQQVDLYDNVQVQRGRDLFRSGVLHYDIVNQRLIGESTPGRRVYAALMPHSQNDSLQGPPP